MAEPLPAAPESREIRVFLSSTFRDFNEERKLLATEVFPELNRRARERGVELVEVDLRWGVTQQQAEGGHALGICLLYKWLDLILVFFQSEIDLYQ